MVWAYISIVAWKEFAKGYTHIYILIHGSENIGKGHNAQYTELELVKAGKVLD